MKTTQTVTLKRKGLSGKLTGFTSGEAIHLTIDYSVPNRTWSADLVEKSMQGWQTVLKVESPGLLSLVRMVDNFARDSKFPEQKFVSVDVQGGMDTMICCEEYWRGAVAQHQRASQYAN